MNWVDLIPLFSVLTRMTIHGIPDAMERIVNPDQQPYFGVYMNREFTEF